MLGHTAIIGYAGRDSELRYTSQGKPYYRFSVGMTEYYKSGDERREKLTWYSCKLWGTRAENLSEYIKKGVHIYLEGRVGSEAYTVKDTNEVKAVITINVSRLRLLDKRAAASQSDAGGETEPNDAETSDEETVNEEASATSLDDWFVTI